VSGSPWSPGLPDTEPSDTTTVAPDVSAPLQKVRVQSSTDPDKGKVLVKEDGAGGGDTKDADDQGNGHANGHSNDHGNAYGHLSQNGGHHAPEKGKRHVNGRKGDTSYKGSHGNGHKLGNGHGKGHLKRTHGRSRH
jgi:hypothetical protein